MRVDLAIAHSIALSDEEKEDLIQYCINLLFPDHCFYDYIHYENSILLSSAQIEDIHNVLLENVFCDEDLCYEIKDLCMSRCSSPSRRY